jgi:hypothetical protein
MATIWIAIISALGVIVASLIQWRSNVATNRAATERAEGESLARERQVEREQNERAAIRAEAREDATQAKLDARHALWREQRQELHRRGIQLLQGYLDAANLAGSRLEVAKMMHGTDQLAELASAAGDAIDEFLETNETELLETTRDAQLIAGNAASLAFVQAIAVQKRHSNLVQFLNMSVAMKPFEDEPANDERDVRVINQIEATFMQLAELLAAYVARARDDLGA